MEIVISAKAPISIPFMAYPPRVPRGLCSGSIRARPAAALHAGVKLPDDLCALRVIPLAGQDSVPIHPAPTFAASVLASAAPASAATAPHLGIASLRELTVPDAPCDERANADAQVDAAMLVNAGRVSAIRDARHMTPQALADWLAQWTS
jgi:hypothetical protein